MFIHLRTKSTSRLRLSNSLKKKRNKNPTIVTHKTDTRNLKRWMDRRFLSGIHSKKKKKKKENLERKEAVIDLEAHGSRENERRDEGKRETERERRGGRRNIRNKYIRK